MNRAARNEIETFMHGLERRNPGEPEFQQAVREVAETLIPFTLDHSEYRNAQILERMTEPDRAIIFRVTWQDDSGQIRANRAWRVQFNNSIGPYKGGMRFHPSVTLSVLKFLGFEQIFKNMVWEIWSLCIYPTPIIFRETTFLFLKPEYGNYL